MFFFFFLCHTLAYNDISHIFNQPISNQPTKSLGIKADYMQRAVVPLVNIFNCLAFDWMVEDE